MLSVVLHFQTIFVQALINWRLYKHQVTSASTLHPLLNVSIFLQAKMGGAVGYNPTRSVQVFLHHQLLVAHQFNKVFSGQLATTYVIKPNNTHVYNFNRTSSNVSSLQCHQQFCYFTEDLSISYQTTLSNVISGQVAAL